MAMIVFVSNLFQAFVIAAKLIYSLHINLYSFVRCAPRPESNPETVRSEVSTTPVSGAQIELEVPKGAVMIPLHYSKDDLLEGSGQFKSAIYRAHQFTIIHIMFRYLSNLLNGMVLIFTIVKSAATAQPKGHPQGSLASNCSNSFGHSQDHGVTHNNPVPISANTSATDRTNHGSEVGERCFRSVNGAGTTAKKLEIEECQRRFKLADNHLKDLLDAQYYRLLTGRYVRLCKSNRMKRDSPNCSDAEVSVKRGDDLDFGITTSNSVLFGREFYTSVNWVDSGSRLWIQIQAIA